MSPHGDDLTLPYDGTVLRRPEPRHVCAPPLADHMMRLPAGPATWPSIDRVRAYVAAGCTHYVLRGGEVAAPGDPWETPCPLHVPPKPTKVGTMAAEPLGTLWRCDCGVIWVVRTYQPPPSKGGYYAGGPPQWYRASRPERRPLRRSFRARLIARLRAAL